MKSFTLETDGKGYWSSKQKKVKIVDVALGCDYTNELQLYFSKKSWNIKEDGLIYTDEKFIKQFRKYLVSKGVPKKIANDIDYTEQGMQGDDYVSLEYGEDTSEYLVKRGLGLN
jgi:hypothetical protein